MNQLDNPYSSLIEIFREQGAKYNAPDLMIGEVLTEEPLTIKVGDIQLDKDNLYIADYLLKDYEREYISESKINIQDGSASGSTSNTNISEHGSHKHNINSITISDGITKDEGKIKTKSSCLKTGDLVAIQQLNKTNQFIIYCKLVRID